MLNKDFRSVARVDDESPLTQRFLPEVPFPVSEKVFHFTLNIQKRTSKEICLTINQVTIGNACLPLSSFFGSLVSVLKMLKVNVIDGFNL